MSEQILDEHEKMVNRGMTMDRAFHDDFVQMQYEEEKDAAATVESREVKEINAQANNFYNIVSSSSYL